MISVISILYLSIIMMFFRDKYSYQAYVVVAMTAVYAFSIFQKYLNFIKNLNILSQVESHLSIIIVYEAAFINVMLGALYFLNPTNKTIYILVTCLVGIEALFIEIRNIINYKTYRKEYLIFNIIDFAFTVYFFIKLLILMNYTYSTYILLVVYILLSEYISRKCYYWKHKKILFNLIDIFIKQNKIDKILKDASNSTVSENFFLMECNSVMKSSFIRVYSLNSIVLYFTKKLSASTTDKKIILKYSSIFSILLANKLMNREYDYTIIPRFTVEPFQDLLRYRAFLKNKTT